ncbi:hypothetical protein HJG60_010750 [Phyllostomus discolor]|uniref:Uncharacterized protein n=1 Tax=Phyllostomus discolor TaxID=89673 RepID=A0A834AH69_9CHIR|nr:hypothetical protein HJG60_010750 [Phyllostomus discolor]
MKDLDSRPSVARRSGVRSAQPSALTGGAGPGRRSIVLCFGENSIHIVRLVLVDGYCHCVVAGAFLVVFVLRGTASWLRESPEALRPRERGIENWLGGGMHLWAGLAVLLRCGRTRGLYSSGFVAPKGVRRTQISLIFQGRERRDRAWDRWEPAPRRLRGGRVEMLYICAFPVLIQSTCAPRQLHPFQPTFKSLLRNEADGARITPRAAPRVGAEATAFGTRWTYNTTRRSASAQGRFPTWATAPPTGVAPQSDSRGL